MAIFIIEVLESGDHVLLFLPFVRVDEREKEQRCVKRSVHQPTPISKRAHIIQREARAFDIFIVFETFLSI